jgi:hypothetical protein
MLRRSLLGLVAAILGPAGIGSCLGPCSPRKGPPPPALSWRYYHCSHEECLLVALFAYESDCRDFDERSWSECTPDPDRPGARRCELLEPSENFDVFTRCTQEALRWTDDMRDGGRWSF